MSLAKQYLAILACLLLLCLSPAYAQDTQPAAKVGQEVTVIIERQQVRFTSRRAIEQMQLQVFNQTGELVYDSGPVAAAEINWPFQNGNGEAINSGLYAYTLSVKEPGAEAARERRGHFIVDRVKDRDGNTDKLWVTSQNDNGVGTELTVARDENATIAGASAPRREGGEVGKRRGEVKRDSEGEAKKKEKAQAELGVAGIGTPGQIAKFISEEEIGDSVITELNGNIGIGTPEPESPLHVHGASGITSTGPGAAFFFRNRQTTTPTDYWAWYSADNVARFWRGGVGDLIGITPDGNVGIGTLMPESPLHVHGASGITSTGPGAAFFFRNRETITPTDYWGWYSADNIARFWRSGVGDLISIRLNGNVGIGTLNPAVPMHLASGAGALRVESTRDDTWSTVELMTPGRLWHTGVGGLNVPNDVKNKYYIRDHTIGAERLVIDTNGNVGLGTIDPQTRLHVVGTTITGTLQINNGADFSENFDINPAADGTAKIKAGLVVAIDPAHPGKLVLSARAYDRRVVGVISGAGGVKPGMVMSQEGTLADGQQPVALSGRVYVWVDATRSAIKPGDPLTTSATPGHAMKATSAAKAQGAIIGKAMTGLKSGKGLVLVLVTLQ